MPGPLLPHGAAHGSLTPAQRPSIIPVVQTPNRQVTYDGDTEIDGVPGSAAPIKLGFRNIAGSKTGSLLPTGNARDTVSGVPVTCIDLAMPMVLVPAENLGKSGYESKDELDSDADFLSRLEAVRQGAARLMGLGDVSAPPPEPSARLFRNVQFATRYGPN